MTSYFITSVPRGESWSRELLAWMRGHRGIENRLHWVRDVTLGEDRCRVQTGAAPQALTSLHNAGICSLRSLGWTNLAVAGAEADAELPLGAQLDLAGDARLQFHDPDAEAVGSDERLLLQAGAFISGR